MANELIDLIKKEIGYTTSEPIACKNCLFSLESENPHVDRDWVLHCHIAKNISLFTVLPNAYCNKFQPKNK